MGPCQFILYISLGTPKIREFWQTWRSQRQNHTRADRCNLQSVYVGRWSGRYGSLRKLQIWGWPTKNGTKNAHGWWQYWWPAGGNSNVTGRLQSPCIIPSFKRSPGSHGGTITPHMVCLNFIKTPTKKQPRIRAHVKRCTMRTNNGITRAYWPRFMFNVKIHVYCQYARQLDILLLDFSPRVLSATARGVDE